MIYSVPRHSAAGTFAITDLFWWITGVCCVINVRVPKYITTCSSRKPQRLGISQFRVWRRGRNLKGGMCSLRAALLVNSRKTFRSHRSEDSDSEKGDSLGPISAVRHKIVVLGGAKVGKSSLISQFLYGTFSPKYKRTVEEMHQGEFNVAGVQVILQVCPNRRQMSKHVVEEYTSGGGRGFAFSKHLTAVFRCNKMVLSYPASVSKTYHYPSR